MADSEPPKDKVKKKKSTTKKSDAPKEKSDAPKEKPAASPDAPKEPADVPPEKPASRKPSAASALAAADPQPPEGGTSPVNPSSRKSSTAVPTEAQNGHPEEGPETEVADVEAVQKSATPKRRPSENVPKKEKKPETELQELDEDKMTELKEAFQLFDLDGDGFIDLPDLRLTFASLGRPDVTDEELKEMLSEATNPMDFDAFVMLLGFKTIALDPEETLRDALSAWDMRNTGLIPQERITQDLMSRGDKFNKEEAHGAFEDAPMFVTDGEKMIDYISFCRTLGSLRKKNTTAADAD